MWCDMRRDGGAETKNSLCELPTAAGDLNMSISLYNYTIDFVNTLWRNTLIYMYTYMYIIMDWPTHTHTCMGGEEN